MERVATVIPTFNRLEWLPGAIESAMAKDWDNMVVIVVNDASTDGTEEWLYDYADKRTNIDKTFYWETHEENQGIPGALNTGIELAELCECDYVEWMSDDDRHYPQKTAVQMKAFKYPPIAKLGLVYSGYDAYWIHGPPENGNRPYRHVRAIPEYHSDRMAQWSALKKACIINGSTAMFPISVFKDVGLFSMDFPYCQDYEMWLRIMMKYNVFRIPMILGDRYEHGKTATDKVVAEGLQEEPQLYEYIKDWEPDTIE